MINAAQHTFKIKCKQHTQKKPQKQSSAKKQVGQHLCLQRDSLRNLRCAKPEKPIDHVRMSQRGYLKTWEYKQKVNGGLGWVSASQYLSIKIVHSTQNSNTH